MLLIFIFLLHSNHIVRAQNCDLNNSKKTQKYLSKQDTVYLLSKFNQFNELTLDCNQTYHVNKSFGFQPNERIIIDSSFDLKKLVSFKDGKSLMHMVFVNFKGIDYNTLPIPYEYVNIYYGFSKLDFYINNTLLDVSHCRREFFKHSFLINFVNINLYYSRYPEFICPYVFLNSYILGLYVTDITNSLLNKNQFNILEVNDLIKFEILIKRLILEIKYETLTTKIMNKNVFECTTNLQVLGVLNNIQADLFYHFTMLEYVDIQIDNFKQLFHRGNKWMMYLNHHVSVNLSDQHEVDQKINSYLHLRLKHRLNMSFFDQIYEYPDEDFCFFQHFPHEHLVVPIIIPGKRIRCSCTLLYLIQYYSYYFIVNYKADYDPYQNYEYYELTSPLFNHSITYCHDKNFNESLLNCNFTKRLKKCKQSSFEVNNKENYESEFKLDNDVDLVYFFKWLQLILIIILQPIFSFFGIVNNALIIMVVQNKGAKKNFKDVMYRHMVINSYFNIFYCAIINLRLMNECVFYLSGTYCSEVYFSEAAQYLKIYLVYFVGNAAKICKNISYFSFTFSRFILGSNKKNGIYKKFTDLNRKAYVSVMIAVGLVLSIFKIFQYSIYTYFDQSIDNVPNEKYSDLSCVLDYSFYCVLFKIFKLGNAFINNILFFVVNMVIDILLIKDLRETIKHKQQLSVKSLHSQNQNEELKSKEMNAKRMVIITNLVYIVSYAPEFVSTILAIVFSKGVSFMNYNFSTNLVNEICEVFGLVALMFNFYIFLIFNKNFRTSFNEIKEKKFKLFRKEPLKKNVLKKDDLKNDPLKIDALEK